MQIFVPLGTVDVNAAILAGVPGASPLPVAPGAAQRLAYAQLAAAMVSGGWPLSPPPPGSPEPEEAGTQAPQSEGHDKQVSLPSQRLLPHFLPPFTPDAVQSDGTKSSPMDPSKHPARKTPHA